MASESLRTRLGFKREHRLHDQALEEAVVALWRTSLQALLSADLISDTLPSDHQPNIALQLPDGLRLLADCEISAVRCVLTPLHAQEVSDKWAGILRATDHQRVLYLLFTNYLLYEYVAESFMKLGLSVFAFDLDAPARETEERLHRHTMRLLEQLRNGQDGRPVMPPRETDSEAGSPVSPPPGGDLIERIVLAALREDDTEFFRLIERARRMGIHPPIASEWLDVLENWAAIAGGESAIRMKARIATLTGTPTQKGLPGAEVSLSDQGSTDNDP